MLVVLYVIFTQYGVIRGDTVPGQYGGAESHFKVVLADHIENNDIVVSVTLYNDNNKMLHQRNMSTAGQLKNYINDVKATGRSVYIATLSSAEGDEDFAKWMVANKGNERAIKRYQDILGLINSYSDINCGEYIAGTTGPEGFKAKLGDNPVCQQFPKSYVELAAIPKARRGNLTAILRELEKMQAKPTSKDVDRALDLAKAVSAKDDETTEQIISVRKTKMDINQKMAALSGTSASTTGTTAAANEKATLESHHERLSNVEQNLYSVGNDIQKAHALLKDIKGKMEATPSTDSTKKKVAQLDFELDKKPVCPVCPLYADSMGSIITDVEVDGYGSIVKPGLEH